MTRIDIMSALRRHRREGLLLAGTIYAVLGALCSVTTGTAAEGVSLLYTLPIALLAISEGTVGGVAGVAAGLGFFAAGASADGIDVGVIGYLTRAVVFVVVGGLGAMVSEQRSQIASANSGWFEMSNDLLVEASLDGYFLRVSEQWERCLGWTRQELMARPFREFIHPDDLALTLLHADALDAEPGEVVNFENRYRAKDGSWRWLLWSARSDQALKYAVARDITERKQLEQDREDLLGKTEELARTDRLTGLPNRRAWDAEIEDAVARAQRHGRPLALAMVDLDHFKRFNDAHGHVDGDALLVDAAARWRLTLRSTDFLARYGGEEFSILLPDSAPEEAEKVLGRLRAVTPKDQTCSVGLAYWCDGDSPKDLVARADGAMYEAKGRGRDRVVMR